MDRTPQTPKYLLAALIVIGVIIGSFGIFSLQKMRAEAATGEIVTGIVTSFEVTKPTTGGGWAQYPVVAYTTLAGEQVEAQARTSSDARIGTEIRVLYQPDNPGRPHLPDETAYWLVPWSAAGVGIFGLFFGLLLWRRNGRAFGLQS